MSVLPGDVTMFQIPVVRECPIHGFINRDYAMVVSMDGRSTSHCSMCYFKWLRDTFPELTPVESMDIGL